MIKKLRKKFVLINMTLVCIVLLIVFAALFISAVNQAQRETKDALDRAAMIKEGEAFPRPKIGPMDHREPFSLVPTFTVTVDENGGVTAISQERAEVDGEVIVSAAGQAMAQDRPEGKIASLGLRYLKREVRGGTLIAFADTSYETAAVTRWLVLSLLVGLGGLGAFLAISLFLARWALKPVEAAWEQQRQFVQDASHELKTPLTVILANTGILLRHKEETVHQQLKWVEYTRDEAERMKKLVDGMLFLAKADAARAPAALAPVHFSDILWSSVLPFESVAFERHVMLESAIAPDVLVMGDEGQLKQLAAILLDNACKYAGEGGKVTVALEKSQDKARLTVHNTGAPIPAEQLPRIFERFYRADSSRARDQGGYGLGLAIARSIAEGHKGRISAESAAGQGTAFTVVLPARDK